MKKLIFILLGLFMTANASTIHFDKSLKEDILSQAKTLTIRKGIRDYYNLGPGLASINDGTQININLSKVEFKKYIWDENNITPELLKKEAMSDISEEGFHRLFRALKKYYPDFEYGDDVTLIFFDLD